MAVARKRNGCPHCRPNKVEVDDDNDDDENKLGKRIEVKKCIKREAGAAKPTRGDKESSTGVGDVCQSGCLTTKRLTRRASELSSACGVRGIFSIVILFVRMFVVYLLKTLFILFKT